MKTMNKMDVFLFLLYFSPYSGAGNHTGLRSGCRGWSWAAGTLTRAGGRWGSGHSKPLARCTILTSSGLCFSAPDACCRTRSWSLHARSPAGGQVWWSPCLQSTQYIINVNQGKLNFFSERYQCFWNHMMELHKLTREKK